ncbi:hypothetical protein FA95DRAFT_1567252 [Auriscalpium vulgare]|uniref:Uncharacterized protein n=1 Tax=Auriscalpium vulgare TaxID=40419 RepID=A0ACB8R566_9AGAM|nr:hypothetical protein FA95DRAFT_1567252 [Auriscalpium vulgare]
MVCGSKLSRDKDRIERGFRTLFVLSLWPVCLTAGAERRRFHSDRPYKAFKEDSASAGLLRATFLFRAYIDKAEERPS